VPAASERHGLLELRDPINQLAAAELHKGFGRD
jgi:hypothetical protein